VSGLGGANDRRPVAGFFTAAISRCRGQRRHLASVADWPSSSTYCSATSGEIVLWGSARAIAVAAERTASTYVDRSANRSFLIRLMRLKSRGLAETLFDHGGMAFGIVPSPPARGRSHLAAPRRP